MKINNVKPFFVNNDHYNNFRAAWAESVNNSEFKLTSAHFLLYAAFRNKDITAGFGLTTRSSKLQNGVYPNIGLVAASRELNWQFRRANDPDTLSYYRCNRIPQRDIVEEFLKPFSGTVSVEMLAALSKDFPTIKPYYPNSKVMSIRPTTYAHLEELYEVA